MQVRTPSGVKALVYHPEAATADQVAVLLRSRDMHVTVTNTTAHCVSALRGTEYPVIVAALVNSSVSPETVSCARPVPRIADSDSPGGARPDVAARAARTASCPPDAGGPPLGLLRTIRKVAPSSRIVALIQSGADLDLCCQAVTLGVTGFVEWDARQGSSMLMECVDEALQRFEATREEHAALHSGHLFDQTGLAGQSRVMAELLLQVRRAAMISDAPVLIHGESGTGKQLIAEAIHRLDAKRQGHPFLSVNCAAIHGTLAESALFGHVRGAYTGATEARQGYFRAAGRGTILLDEISELESPLQPKLLRVLQEGTVLPVGSDVEAKVTARVIAASNRPLPALVEEHRFRLDLYQRLNVISLNIPPLRDRPEDVPLLVHFFLRKYASYYPAGIDEVDPRVYEVLTQSIGSGNVRELENTVRRILAFKEAGHRLELSDLPAELLECRRRRNSDESEAFAALVSAACEMIRSGRWTLQTMVDEFERLALREVLTTSDATHVALAQKLGVTRRTLYNKIQKYELYDDVVRDGD